MTKNNERPLINVVSQGAPVLSFTRGYSLKGCGDVVCFCVGLESDYCEFITAAMPNAEPPRVYLYATKETQFIHGDDRDKATIIEFPEYKGWVFHACTLYRYTLSVVLTKKQEKETKDLEADDPIVESVRSKLLLRSATGVKKYGTTLERNDLSRLEWLRHAQEEALDLANYLEVLIQREGGVNECKEK